MRWFFWWRCFRHRKHKLAGFRIAITTPGLTDLVKRKGKHMDLQIFDDGKGVKFVATPVNKAGKTIPLPTGESITWTSSDPAVLSVATDPTDPSGLTALGSPVADGTGVTATITGTATDGTKVTDTSDPVDVVPDAALGGFTIQETAL